MFCRMCGVQIPDHSEVCPVCGAEQHITMTEETEKEKGTGKTAAEILKGTGRVIGKVGGTILMATGSMVFSIVSEEVGKGVQKKTKKVFSDVLKATGLKKKTPLDIAVKRLKQCRRR